MLLISTLMIMYVTYKCEFAREWKLDILAKVRYCLAHNVSNIQMFVTKNPLFPRINISGIFTSLCALNIGCNSIYQTFFSYSYSPDILYTLKIGHNIIYQKKMSSLFFWNIYIIRYLNMCYII